MVDAEKQRIGKELMILIRKIKGEYLRKGKKPPSSSEITDRIAKKMKQEGILFNDFINL